MSYGKYSDEIEKIIKAFENITVDQIDRFQTAVQNTSKPELDAAWGVAYGLVDREVWAEAQFAIWDTAWSRYYKSSKENADIIKLADSLIIDATWDAALAWLAKDQITIEQFNVLNKAWDSVMNDVDDVDDADDADDVDDANDAPKCSAYWRLEGYINIEQCDKREGHEGLHHLSIYLT